MIADTRFCGTQASLIAVTAVTDFGMRVGYDSAWEGIEPMEPLKTYTASRPRIHSKVGVNVVTPYSFLADLVLLVHFIFVAVAVFGSVGIFINYWWAFAHVPIVLWSSAVNLAGWTCPLTPLEKRLRNAAGGMGYKESFTQHYIALLVYPRGMPRRLELVAGFSILIWNMAVYAIILWLH